MSLREHSVLFYQSEAQIDEAAARYIYEGMAQGQDAIVIAGARRRAALIPHLIRFGMDSFRRNASQLLMYDAQTLLHSFMVDGMPNEELFQSALAPIFAKARGTPRAYGEMVGILTSSGQFEAALRLEELWNREIARRCFPLFCGYPRASFGKKTKHHLEAICERHTHVTPI